MKILFAILLFCSLLLADTATVVPDGDNSTDSWSSTPLWSNVDEDIDSPGGDTISSGNNPSSPANNVVFDVTCPANLSELTEANLRVRAQKNNNNRTLTLALSWSATAATNFNAALTTGMANYASGNQTGLSVSKAVCDSSTITIAPATGGGSGQPTSASVDGVNLDITYTASSGRREVQIVRLERNLRELPGGVQRRR